MKEKWNLGLVALAMVVMCAAGAFAQHPCDTAIPGTPGDGCPDFRYYEATGLMSFDADGENVQSMLITGPDPGVSGLLNPDGNFPDAAAITGTTWTVVNAAVTPLRVLTGTYSYFGGRSQNIMFTDTANTGWVNGELDVIQYAAGVTAMDFPSVFGQIEMSTYDTDPMNPPPSTTVFTEPVHIPVPEPAVLSLLGAALLGLGLIRRR